MVSGQGRVRDSAYWDVGRVRPRGGRGTAVCGNSGGLEIVVCVSASCSPFGITAGLRPQHIRGRGELLNDD